MVFIFCTFASGVLTIPLRQVFPETTVYRLKFRSPWMGRSRIVWSRASACMRNVFRVTRELFKCDEGMLWRLSYCPGDPAPPSVAGVTLGGSYYGRDPSEGTPVVLESIQPCQLRDTGTLRSGTARAPGKLRRGLSLSIPVTISRTRVLAVHARILRH